MTFILNRRRSFLFFSRRGGFPARALKVPIYLMLSLPVLQAPAQDLKFVGSVSFLSQKEANKIWGEIQSFLKEMDGFCSVKKDGKPPQKKPQTNQWIAQIQKLKSAAGDLYKTHKYSFNGIKITDGGRKADLGITLLNINAVLNSSHITSSIKGDKTCKSLKDGFVFAYASYVNIQDTADPVKAMPPWAGRVYASINCLCP